MPPAVFKSSSCLACWQTSDARSGKLTSTGQGLFWNASSNASASSIRVATGFSKNSGSPKTDASIASRAWLSQRLPIARASGRVASTISPIV